jgi:DNA-binding transcriptional MerR regulator
MRDLISIGRFAQITGLTIKALHIYDRKGLLCPAFVNPDSGYRYYSITQLPIAHRIRLLRGTGMPLAAIHAVLHALTPEAMETLLHDHQQRIADRIRKDRHALRILQQLIDHQADDMAFTVQTKELPAQLIASVRIRAAPADESRMIPMLVDELHTSMTELGVRRDDAPPLRISHEYSEDMVDAEIAVPITQPVAGREGMACRELEAGSVAWVMHVGPHADLWAVYWTILVWIQEHGYEQNGPPREVYWMHPSDGDVVAYRTEVQWPIRLLHPHESPFQGVGHAT